MRRVCRHVAKRARKLSKSNEEVSPGRRVPSRKARGGVGKGTSEGPLRCRAPAAVGVCASVLVVAGGAAPGACATVVVVGGAALGARSAAPVESSAAGWVGAASTAPTTPCAIVSVTSKPAPSPQLLLPVGACGVGAAKDASCSPAREGGGGGMLVGAPSSSFNVAGAIRTPPLPWGWAVAGAGDAVGIS